MSDDAPTRKRPLPPLLQPEKVVAGRRRVKRSQKNEKRVATAVNGRVLKRSGGAYWSPNTRDTGTARGDLKTPDFFIEHKMTVNESLSVKKAWLHKLELGAQRAGKDPGLCVTFESQDGRKQDDWMLLPMEVFKRLCRTAGIEID